AQSTPPDAGALAAYAEFLDLHRDPEAGAAYEKLWKTLSRPEDRGRADAVAKRLLALDLTAGDEAAAERHFKMYKDAGGSVLTLNALGAPQKADSETTIEIPGPLRSFARMAALSPDLKPGELLPAL